MLNRLEANLLIEYLKQGPTLASQTIEGQMRMLNTKSRVAFIKARHTLEREGYIILERHGRTTTITISPTFTSSIVGWWGGVWEGSGDSVCISKLVSILGSSSSGSGSGLNGRDNDGEVSIGIRNEYLSDERVSEIDTSTSGIVSEIDTYSEERVSETDTIPETVSETDTSVTETVSETDTYSNKGYQKQIPIEDRCAEIDEMDDTGPETSRKSPFAIRRKAQVEVIREVWGVVFPKQKYPLTERNARAMLGLCENSAVMLLEELQDFKRRKPDLDEGSPLAYVMKALKGRAAQDSGPRFERKASTTSVVGKGAAAYYPGGDLPKPTDEWWDEVKEAHKQAEKTKRERQWEE